MLNTELELRQTELEGMKVVDLKALAKEHGIKLVSTRKAEIIEEILMHEESLYDEEVQAANEDDYLFQMMKHAMENTQGQEFREYQVEEEQEEVHQEPKQEEIQQQNQGQEQKEEPHQEQAKWWNLVCEMNKKNGQPFNYEHFADRPEMQRILLTVCRDLYLDCRRAVKVSNGDKTVEQFGPVFVSKKHNGLRMKDSMAKGTVKAAAEKILSKEQQKKFIVLNTATKHMEFKQATQILAKLNDAELIVGEKTDKDYAMFYSVNPEAILAFLNAVGCLKK